MKVVNPNNTSHEIQVIPRHYLYDTLVMELYNEETRLTVNSNATFQNVDGFLYLFFDYNFIEGQKFQIKIMQDTDIIYRGKLMATSQDTQTYKASKDLYYYE